VKVGDIVETYCISQMKTLDFGGKINKSVTIGLVGLNVFDTAAVNYRQKYRIKNQIIMYESFRNLLELSLFSKEQN
jgi:hypothetical protein